VHGLPMSLRGQIVGALDIVGTAPLRLDASQMASAQMLADVAVSYLANSRAFGQATVLAEQLQRALDSRVVIEQAKGKLAERHGTDSDDAFARLRSHARHRGLKLHDVAVAVLRDELRI
jgi:AmiR/NasT family two-component response regulator